MVPALQNEKDFFFLKGGGEIKEIKQNKTRKTMGRREGEVGEEKCARKQYKKSRDFDVYFFPPPWLNYRA